VEIPNRPVFRPQEVCEIAEVQPYVLRSWEAEFPDLGVAKAAGGPRIYRRADVERVLRLKHLLFGEGLTLAGARKRMMQETGPVAGDAVTDADVSALLDEHARQSLRDIRGGLQWILGLLNGDERAAAASVEFALEPQTAAAASVHARAARPAPAAVRSKAPKKSPKGKKR